MNIFRASLSFGFIPKAWQEVKVVFIPKPGKDSYALAICRPISLSFFLLETMEGIVDRRYMRDDTLKAKPRIRQESLLNLAIHETVIVTIEKALNSKEFALGAFNEISFSSTTKATNGFGVKPTVGRWIDSMLRNRLVTAQYGNSWKSGEASK